MTAILRIEVLSPIPRPLTNGTLRGNAQGICIFQLQGVQLVAGLNPTINIACDSPLPNTTKLFDPVDIQWTYTLNGRAYDISTSRHKIFVTLAQPLDSPVYLSVLNLAVANGGASDASQAFAKSWALFGTGTSPSNVKGWDGRAFYYYPTGTPFGGCATDTLALLTSSTGAGRCGSFARLFVAVNRVNGISPGITQVTTLDRTFFLVKHWDLGPPTLGDPIYRWVYLSPLLSQENEMLPVPPGNKYGDVTNLPGVAGQNSSTPSEKAFFDHAIVQFSGTYYDPSYGLLYSGEADFQTKAVAAFVNPTGLSKKVRGPTLPNNMKFTPF